MLLELRVLYDGCFSEDGDFEYSMRNYNEMIAVLKNVSVCIYMLGPETKANLEQSSQVGLYSSRRGYKCFDYPHPKLWRCF